MNVERIISVAVTLVSLLLGAFSAIKERKSKKDVAITNEIADAAVKTSDFRLKMCQGLPSLITEAERVFVGEKMGQARQSYVLAKIEIQCVKNNVEFDEDDWINRIKDVMATPQSKE